MKEINPDQIHELPGQRIEKGQTFSFRCSPGIGCFNRCCRNLNLFLYPYDVVRLKNHLGITSAEFIDQYVDVVLRPGDHFPEALLRMKEDPERTCIFMETSGCAAYADRPDTCRNFPVERGLLYDKTGRTESVYFFRPPEFCLGRYEDRPLTIEDWIDDQDARLYGRMTALWAEVKSLFQENPWGAEGPGGPKAKMAFMAAYNIDQFRDFVFQSSFLKRYYIPKPFKKKLRADDTELLKLGFEWIKFYLWGIRPTLFNA
jgi:hypothetical protein